MDARQLIKHTLRYFHKKLVDENFQAIIERAAKSRLSVQEFERIITDYNATFVVPPLEYDDDHLVIFDVDSEESNRWMVDAPLWSKEEGLSDLTLTLTVIKKGDRLEVEIDDLHVL